MILKFHSNSVSSVAEFEYIFGLGYALPHAMVPNGLKVNIKLVLGDIFGPETETLMIPIIVLYNSHYLTRSMTSCAGVRSKLI